MNKNYTVENKEGKLYILWDDWRIQVEREDQADEAIEFVKTMFEGEDMLATTFVIAPWGKVIKEKLQTGDFRAVNIGLYDKGEQK